MRCVFALVGLLGGCGRLSFDAIGSSTDGSTDDGPQGLAITKPDPGADVGPVLSLEGSCVSGTAISITGTGVETNLMVTCVGSMFAVAVVLTAGFGSKKVIVTQDGVSVTRTFQRVPQQPAPFTARSGTTVSAGPATPCDLAIAAPNVTAGQLIVGMIYSDGGVGPSISTPGFTRLQLDSGVAVAFFKVAGSTEPAMYTFNIVAGSGATDTCASGGVLVGIKNVDPNDPIESDNAAFGASGSLVAPSVTPTIATTILGVFGSNGPGSGITKPASMTFAPDAAPNGSFAISPDTAGNALIAWEEVAAGATGTRTATISANSNHASGLIVLRPQ